MNFMTKTIVAALSAVSLIGCRQQGQSEVASRSAEHVQDAGGKKLPLAENCTKGGKKICERIIF